MDALDRLVPYYRAFNRLPFVVRRILLVMMFLGSFVVGVKLRPYSEDLGFAFLMSALFGLLWATGVWRLWKPLAIILAIWLRMNY
ncbi:hypothetical protein [Paraburkholderia sp. GAS334]|uniref:hypothetical protein n=1 Tax=Paraburkholderia sp. GAS334 TaxID=3035131 RepID=UPI003D1D5855